MTHQYNRGIVTTLDAPANTVLSSLLTLSFMRAILQKADYITRLLQLDGDNAVATAATEIWVKGNGVYS